MQNNHMKEILFRKLCYEKVVLLLSVTVKILYLECCVMKKLLYCFFVRSNNLNSVNNSLINRSFGQIQGQIVLGLFKFRNTTDNLSRN